MQNIEELVQQLIISDDNNDYINLKSKLSEDQEKQQQNQQQKNKQEKKNVENKINSVKIPISMLLLDQILTLKSISQNSPTSPTIPSGSSSSNSNSNSTTSPTNSNNTSTSTTSPTTNSNNNNNNSTFIIEYENKINLIKETLNKIIAKQIPNVKEFENNSFINFDFPTIINQSDSIVRDILNSYEDDLQDEQANCDIEFESYSSHHNNSIFGPTPSPRSIQESQQSHIKNYNSFKIHWASIILKIHQAIIQSGLYQNLIKKIGNVFASSQLTASHILVNQIKDPKFSKGNSSSLSSGNIKSLSSSHDENATVAKPSKIDQVQSIETQSTRSTPTTPPYSSPSNHGIGAQSADQDELKIKNQQQQQQPQKQPITTSPNSGRSLLSNVLNGNGTTNNTTSSPSSTTTSSSSSRNSGNFSLSALMSGNNRDAPPALKDLADRSTKIDQVRGFTIADNPQHQLEPPTSATNYQQPFNPNMNKLPSSYETDPILLPDGSEFSNARQPTLGSSFNSNNTIATTLGSSFNSNNTIATTLSSTPSSNPIFVSPPVTTSTNTNPMNIQQPQSNSLFSPTSSNPLSGSFGVPTYSSSASNRGGFSTSPFDIPSSSGMPPQRLTESFFSTSASSRAPPGCDAIPPLSTSSSSNQQQGIQIPNAQQQQQQIQTGFEISPSPSNQSYMMNNNNNNPLSLSGSFTSNRVPMSYPPNIELNPPPQQQINPQSLPNSNLISPSSQQQPLQQQPLQQINQIPQQPQQQINQQPIFSSSPSVPAIDNTIVPASSSFKATTQNSSSASQSSSANNNTGGSNISAGSTSNKVNLDNTVKSLSKPIVGFSDLILPEWLDITIYWSNDCSNYEKDLCDGEISLELRKLLLAEKSGGRLDHYLECTLVYLIQKKLLDVIKSKISDWIEPIYNYWIKSINIQYYYEICKQFNSFVSEFNSHLWDSRKYNAFLNRIVNLRRQFPPPSSSTATTGIPTSNVTSKGLPIPIQLNSLQEQGEMNKILKQIECDITYLISIQHQSSIRYLEKLLIGLMGHTIEEVRQSSVRLLNVIYDGHNWQFEEPLKPVIRVIGDAFKVEIELENQLPEDVLKRIHILTVQPPNQRLTNLITDQQNNNNNNNKQNQQYNNNSSTTILNKYKPKVDGNKIYIELPSFYRSGYYDWKIVELLSNGEFKSFDYNLYKLKTNSIGSSSSTTTLSSSSNSTINQILNQNELIQGRFIVHPKLREETMHEVWVDLQDSVWDPYRGEMVKRGTIQNLIDSLPLYQQEGITTLYVMGLLEKLPTNQPLCPTDRDLPNRILGGVPLFNQLVSRAKQLGIKIVIDSTTRLSSKAAHRKYKGVICHTLDNNGQLSRLEGTDSVEFNWNDCLSMNMRKLSVWEMFVKETILWGERGVDGVRIDSSHTCPLLFRSNLDELYRLDSDDLPHYTNQQIFEGEIVMRPSEEGKNFGYWGTTPPSPKQSTPFYPNPFFIKITREIWNCFPQFIFLAEVFWERELHSIISGLVPYSSAIPKALASVFDKGISKDGIVFDLRQRQTVKALYDYYEMRMTTYPQNSIILFPSSTHHSPYPLQVYNAGAWVAVDMLYFLPEIPITYIGEQSGWYYAVDISSGRVKVGMSSTPYQLQYPQIHGHYQHRATLRRNHTLLRRGGMIPLLCYHQNGWNDRVFGFARFSGNEVAIIAINFDNTDTEFYVDCSPLAKICNDSDTIYRMVDLINPSNPPQYLSLNELLYEKHFVVAPGYSSICWGVYHQVNSPAATRVLYEHSMTRLKQLLADNVDPNNNLIYSLIKNSLSAGVNEFGKCLENILSNLSGNTEKTFSSFVQSVLYHLTRTFEGYKIISYLQVLAKNQTIPKIPKISKEILQHNILGPIVFITPEIGRFSTVGGVGVMLDELTRSLQLLGCEIHIISPYYNYGKGGRTGYLEKEEGITWKRNVLTYVGPDRVEVGVHEGMDKGIHLHFLHHFEYFPTPYNSGSPIHQLKTIVLFAKASLELLCQLRILPSVVVTNDWFTGLVPGYAKSGAFGTTFNGTTFFHLVHNLEEAYQGRIYPDGGDDLNWIHHLHRDLIVDPYSHQLCLNASRCALLSCNNWGTVSKSYLYDLLRTSHLSNLLHRFPDAFAHSNGIRVKERKEAMRKVSNDHWSAKAELQKKYFNNVDKSIPVLSFVGRIVLQKGVHLILNAVRELIQHYQGKIQILVGGMANMKDPYASSCAWSMQALCKQYPQSFWADPDAFFSDGPLVNLGSDFGLMPSLFEPSGVVQQEYFVAGTPVIAFKTGGLKDTVFEYSTQTEQGNGFTFEAHKHTDYVQAIHRAINIFNNENQYEIIRKRAEESVLDMSVVAEAWAREFSRLRRSIYYDKNKIEEELESIEKSLPVIDLKQKQQQDNSNLKVDEEKGIPQQ